MCLCIFAEEKFEFAKEFVIKFNMIAVRYMCIMRMNEWTRYDDGNSIANTAIHLIKRNEISPNLMKQLGFIKIALNEMNLRNQQNFFSPRYAE